MGNNLDFSILQPSLTDAKDVLVLITINPSLDNVAASLALYLGLKKQNKNVTIGCITPMTVAFNRLIGVDKISNQIGNRNLVISFDYIKDSIEKVSYNIEDNKFNLVVEPKPNLPPLDSDKVSYTYTGIQADLIFIIGATKLEDLDNFYFQNKNIFTEKQTVNIDNKPNNTRFGKINFYDSQAASCSEIVFQIIKALSLPVDEDISTNIYAGIRTNTSNFQTANISASTFEAAAWCLQNGAKKNHLVSPPNIGIQSKPTNSFPAKSYQPISYQPQIFSQPVSQPMITVDKNKSENSVPPPPFVQNNSQKKDEEKQPPPDWFKPKIYKGNQLA